MRIGLLLTPVILAVLLTGCGGGTTSGSMSSNTSSASSKPASWDCSEGSGLSMKDWTEHCASAAGAEGGAELTTISLGTPYELVAVDDPDQRETMTIKGVECGLSELADGAANPKWDGSDDIPKTITAEAEPGMEFCRITATFQVTGKKPVVGWTDFANLVAKDGTEYAEDEKASEATSTINYEGMPSACSPTLCSTLNPGSAAFDVVKIYHVPAGTQPKAVQYPMETLMSGPEVLLDLI